jgi:hypothetical protein
MIIVRRADLFPPEAATCEPSRLNANLDRWLTDPVSRAVVMEMDEVVHGRPSKILQQTSQDELKRSVKLRLEQAFKQRSLVGVLVPRSFLTQIKTTDGDESPANAPPPKQNPNKPLAWIEIELIDDAGKPVADERYRIEKPDGSFEEGRLDKQGRARVDNLDPGTCQVTFPDIDAKEWTAA